MSCGEGGGGGEEWEERRGGGRGRGRGREEGRQSKEEDKEAFEQHEICYLPLLPPPLLSSHSSPTSLPPSLPPSLSPSSPHLHEGGGLQLAELPHASGDLIVRHSGQHFCRSLQEAHDGIVGHTELVCGLDDLGMGESEIGNMGM